MTFSRVLLLSAGLLLSVGCASGSKSTEPAKEGAKAPAGSKDGNGGLAVDDAGPAPFDILVESWEGPAGEEGQVVVTVKAKDGYKINDKYPHKVSLESPPAGLDVPLKTIAKKDAQLNGDKSITYTIPATATKVGEYELKGTIRLSVCNEDTCRMAKEPMVASISAQ